MAKRLPTQCIIAAFADGDAVDSIEKLVTDVEFETHQIICTNMAVAKKDAAGKLQIRELGNPKSLESNVKKSATVEGLIRGMGLMLLGETGAKKAIEADESAKGAALARLSLRKIQGFEKERLHKIGNALGRGNAAIILVFDEILVSKDRYDGLGFTEAADDLVDDIAAGIEKELKAGNDIAYHITIG